LDVRLFGGPIKRRFAEKVDSFLLHGPNERSAVVAKLLLAQMHERKSRVPIRRGAKDQRAGLACFLKSADRSVENDKEVYVAVGTGLAPCVRTVEKKVL
jgi:hypothetical protein